MERFDYVIVGAGSAECVLAHRLTEDASTSVLLPPGASVQTDEQLDASRRAKSSLARAPACPKWPYVNFPLS